MSRSPEQLAAALLSPDRPPGDLRCLRLEGGRNNQAWRVETEDGPYFLKCYFRSPADPRDRLHHEWSLARYAWTLGLRNLPEPLAADPGAGAALFRWIDKRPANPADLQSGSIAQAIDFLVALNASHASPPDLPLASEACFTLAEHLAVVRQRIERLRNGIAPEPDTAAARTFVTAKLAPAFGSIAGRLEREGSLPEVARIVSPSDFGFHNALIGPEGSITWIDFEYAGWDDPAKTVSDFFAQPRLPVPEAFRAGFVDRLEAEIPGLRSLGERARRLRPLLTLKWACIQLNEFLDIGSARREFARAGSALEKARARQLEAAGETLRRALLSD